MSVAATTRCSIWRADLRRVFRSDSQASSWTRAFLASASVPSIADVGFARGVASPPRSSAGVSNQVTSVSPFVPSGRTVAAVLPYGGSRVSRAKPAMASSSQACAALVGEAGDDQVVAGAGEGYIEEAALFGVLLALLLCLARRPSPSGWKLPILSQPSPVAWSDDDVLGAGGGRRGCRPR